MNSWLVVPATAATGAAIAGALGAGWTALAAGLAAAAVSQSVRTLAGDGIAVVAGAALAGVLAVVSMIELAGAQLLVPWLALAATASTIALFAPGGLGLAPIDAGGAVAPSAAAGSAGTRVSGRTRVAGSVGMSVAGSHRATSTMHRAAVATRRAAVATRRAAISLANRRAATLALVPATFAAVLAPSSVALVALVAVRLPRSRWRVGVTVVGCAAIAVAVVAAADAALWFAPSGSHASGATIPRASLGALVALADALGPLAVVAALGGLAVLARAELPNLALATCIAGALLVDLRAGSPGAITLGLAALCAGVAVGRFASQIRIAAGQAIVGATCGMLLLLPPAWAAIAASR